MLFDLCAFSSIGEPDLIHMIIFHLRREQYSAVSIQRAEHSLDSIRVKFGDGERSDSAAVNRLIKLVKRPNAEMFKSSHLHLYSTFNNTQCVKAALTY